MIVWVKKKNFFNSKYIICGHTVSVGFLSASPSHVPGVYGRVFVRFGPRVPLDDRVTATV